MAHGTRSNNLFLTDGLAHGLTDSLADNWEKQRRESQKVQRQSSRDAG